MSEWISPVVCSAKDDSCPSDCRHALPHKHVYDKYDEACGYCDEERGTCCFRTDMPVCICEELET